MLRKTISIVCAICILMAMFVTTLPVYAETQTLRPRKIVSVVYDDSRSMKGDRWAYANYATQALIAFLDQSDELHITYMSEPGKSYKKSLNEIDQAVEDMRNWNKVGVTPGKSLDTAKKALDNVAEDDANVQFWLVVMTDGEITFDDSNTTVQSKLDSFKGDKMSNGSSLNVVYLRMGSDDTDVTADEKGGLYAYFAKDDKEVEKAIFNMASLVSGRIDVENLKQVDDKTITFSSRLPAYSISILSQQSNAKIKSAVVGETKLNIERNVSLAFTQDALKLFGNAGVVNNKSAGNNQVIPSGTYTVTFTENVSVNDLLVQYEPAINLKLELHKDKKLIDDISKIAKDNVVDASIKPVISGTDTVIPIDDLPKGVSWGMEYEVDGNVIDSASGTELNAIKIQEGKNVIRGYLQLPGYSPLVVEVAFDIIEVVYNLTIAVDQPSPLEYNRGSLNDGSIQGSAVTFVVMNDGIPLAVDTIKDLGINIIITNVECDDSGVEGFLNRFGKWKIKCSIKMNDDGSFTLIPKENMPFVAFLLLAGEYTVDVALSTDNTVTSCGRFTVIPSILDWLDLPLLILILLILAYILHLIFKPKFHGEVVNYELYKLIDEGKGLSQNAFDFKKLKMTTGLFVPGRASRCKFHNLELVAEAGRVIIVTDKSVAKTVYAYGPDSANPLQKLGRIVRNLKTTECENGDRVASELSLTGTNENQRIYFKTAKTDRNIWCIWLS